MISVTAPPGASYDISHTVRGASRARLGFRMEGENKRAPMPEPIPSAEPRVTGDEIIQEILRNMEAGLFRIRYTTLVPAVFRVYLHPEDYEPIRGAVPLLTEEIRRVLNERLAEWNKPPGLLDRLAGSGQRTEYKIVAEDWTVEFLPDVEGRLERGDIEVYSELGAPPKPEYGAGALTRRITRRDASGEKTTREITAPEPGTVYARIRYEDNSGPHEYAVATGQVVIGRGGKAYWVDLRLDTAPDVSREHCRIRRDPVSGRFYLKDVSQFGTTVNGKPVPSSIEKTDGRAEDRNIETPLPARARIGLAGIVYLDFEQTA